MAKHEVARSDVACLTAEAAAQKANSAAESVGHERRLEEMQREMIAMLQEAAVMMRPKEARGRQGN